MNISTRLLFLTALAATFLISYANASTEVDVVDDHGGEEHEDGESHRYVFTMGCDLVVVTKSSK